jgi:hypothetical protein
MCVVYPTLQAQTLHPLSDIAVVRPIIEQLGDEMVKRMTAAGATPGSRQVGWLLRRKASIHMHHGVCRGCAAWGLELGSAVTWQSSIVEHMLQCAGPAGL